ncbi:MAG: efflux transporter outer membrane subunit [Burkholderiales bacterium]|nr:efflux transporter outer membrane subunit [Burkholderiales bacterium]
MSMTGLRSLAGLCLPMLLAACATQPPPAHVDAAAPARWNAPLPAAGDADLLPHQGTQGGLSAWWRQRSDPVLVELIESAQAVSPTVAAAGSRIEQARAVQVAAGATLLPSLGSSLSATKAGAQVGTPAGTSVSGALQAAWEIDLFGANRGARDGATARFEGAQAGWHEARVSVAAEVANVYYGARACALALAVTRADATSRAETSRLSELNAAAGFLAPATAALARASAAEANARATQQEAQCDLDVKALVALTGLAEADVRGKLVAAPTALPQDAPVAIAALPAQTLAQRPDVYAAGREVAAASAEVGSAQAQRFPRLSLNGSVGVASLRSGGVTTDLTTWSIGPLSLTLPLFDAGKRAADVDAARARYDEAAARYRASVRQAVREVEEALVNLHSTGARAGDAATAANGYVASFAGTESRYNAGLASLMELEESRRTRLAAELALVSLQRERVAAWVALYRAAGGGWSADAAPRP